MCHLDLRLMREHPNLRNFLEKHDAMRMIASSYFFAMLSWHSHVSAHAKSHVYAWAHLFMYAYMYTYLCTCVLTCIF